MCDPFLHGPFQVRKLAAPPPGHPPGEHYVVDLQLKELEEGPIKFYQTPHGGEVATWGGTRLPPDADDELFKEVKAAVDAYDAAHPKEVA